MKNPRPAVPDSSIESVSDFWIQSLLCYVMIWFTLITITKKL